MDKIFKDYTLSEVSAICTDAYRNTSSVAKYTAEERKAGRDAIINELGKDYENNYRKIFAIIEEVVKEVVPQKIEDDPVLNRIIEVRRFKPNEDPLFILRQSNVKAYVTAHGGSVSRHRIDNRQMRLEMKAIQVHVYEEWTRLRAGLVDFNELIDYAVDALQEKLYELILDVLNKMYDSLPDTNKVIMTGSVDEKELNRLISIVSSYSTGKPIFIGTHVALSLLPEVDSIDAKNDVYHYGLQGFYKGCPLLEMKNIVTDGSNEEFILDDRYLYIVPQDRNALINVALRDSFTRSKTGEDWTEGFISVMEVGVGVLANNNICAVDLASLVAGK